MTAKIIEFKRPAEQAVSRAVEADLEKVVVIGFGKDGRFCLYAGGVTNEETLSLLRTADFMVMMEVYEGMTGGGQ